MTIIGEYELERNLGEGGMGVVYLGRHLKNNSKAAIKLMKENSMDFDSIARFKREARLLKELNHPGIIRVFDYDVSNSVPYMIMEYCEGLPASGILQIDDCNVRRKAVVDFVKQVSESLVYAHNLGVVHRDLKPGNVLKTSHGKFRVADFGLAKCIEDKYAPRETRKFQTRAGIILGTPQYMPPEFLNDEVNVKSDIYSLGIIMYHFLERRLPFQSNSILEMLGKHACEPLPIMHNAFELEKLVRMCCEKRFENRPSADEVLISLEKVI